MGPHQRAWAEAIGRLYVAAKEPPYGDLAGNADVSRSTCHLIIGGKRLANWQHTEQVIAALAADPEDYERLWEAARLELRAARDGQLPLQPVPHRVGPTGWWALIGGRTIAVYGFDGDGFALIVDADLARLVRALDQPGFVGLVDEA